MNTSQQNTRIGYCKNCKADTPQFIQFNLAIFDNDTEAWFCRNCNKEVTELTKEELREKLEYTRHTLMKGLLSCVADYYGLTPEDLKGISRKSKHQTAKQVFYYLAHKFNRYNSRTIGRFVGRDHVSIFRGIRNVKGWLEHDRQIQRDVRAITNMVLNNHKSYLLRRILQQTPIENLPELVMLFEDHHKKTAPVKRRVPAATGKN